MKVFQGNKSNKSNDSLDPIRPIHHKKRFILLALVFLALIFAGTYYFFLRPSETNTSNQGPTEPVTVNDEPIDNIIYAFGVSFDSDADIFSRDFTEESEREPLHSLSNIDEIPQNSFDSNLLGFQVSYSYATVVGDDEIWGADGDKEAGLIYKLDESFGSSELVSALINRNGDKVAFTTISKTTKVADLWIYDMLTKTVASAAKDVKSQPFAWSADNKKLFLGPNVVSADYILVPAALDIASGQQIPLFDSVSSNDFGVYNVSIDGAKSTYIKPTLDKNKVAGPPYKIFMRSLDNGQLSEVKDIRSDKPPASLVFDQQSKNLFWAEGPKLFSHSIEAGSSEELFDNDKESIAVVYAATSNQVIIGIKLPDNTYGVYVVDLEKKTKSLIMETTDSTSGVGFVIDK